MIIILMGVSGSGKTTIGDLLSAELRWPFFDADSFHPAENIRKMSAGIPLTDADRLPWLQAIRAKIDSLSAKGESAIIACSALKASYRKMLSDGISTVKFVYLKGDYDLLHARLEAREIHFMKPEMLESQFETLEEPGNALIIDVKDSPQEIVKQIRSAL